jgi:hypothetical protein
MSADLEITFACPASGCGAPVVGPLAPVAPACARCGQATALADAAQAAEGEVFGPCPLCGSADLYTQRDFNRKLGLTLAAIGLALGPFTAWISTIVAIALDAVLYVTVPSVVICYACQAQVRGVAKERRPPAFEIALHDVYKFNRRHPPRPEVAVAGPLAQRLRHEAGN